MHGEGRTEAFLGEAHGRAGDRVFLVSKVYPHNASRQGVRRACEGSLGRLRTDRLDLYLLHWRGREPAGGDRGRLRGPARGQGNAPLGREQLRHGRPGGAVSRAGGERCAVNQVLYSLTQAGPEWDLLPWMDTRRMPSWPTAPWNGPATRGRRPGPRWPARLGATPWQVALAWILRRPEPWPFPRLPQAPARNHAALGLTLAEAPWAS